MCNEVRTLRVWKTRYLPAVLDPYVGQPQGISYVYLTTVDLSLGDSRQVLRRGRRKSRKARTVVVIKKMLFASLKNIAYITTESLNWHVLLCFRCILYSGPLVILF